jgi:hypothetical protein
MAALLRTPPPPVGEKGTRKVKRKALRKKAKRTGTLILVVHQFPLVTALTSAGSGPVHAV